MVTRKRHNGGGLGADYAFKTPSFGSLVQNPYAIASVSSCQTADRHMVVPSKGALPGMGGGARKSKKSKQRGGRYGSTFESVGMGAPWGSAIPSVQRIGCDGSSSPLPPNNAFLNKVGGPLWDSQKGGNVTRSGNSSQGDSSLSKQPFIDQGYEQAGGFTSGSGSGSASASANANTNASVNENPNAYTVPTAGYTQLANPAGIISTGTGTLLPEIVPVNARHGGSRKNKNKKNREANKSRKSKKSRKIRR